MTSDKLALCITVWVASCALCYTIGRLSGMYFMLREYEGEEEGRRLWWKSLLG